MIRLLQTLGELHLYLQSRSYAALQSSVMHCYLPNTVLLIRTLGWHAELQACQYLRSTGIAYA